MNNIKRNIFLVLAAAVLLASCGQDEVMTDTGHDGLVPVTLSAAVGDGVQTRTVDADNDEKPTRCYVQAFTTDDNGTTLTPAPGDLARPLDMGEPTAEGTFSLSDVYINPNETYVFLYWADNVEKNDAPDLEDLRFADYFKDRIAWAKRSEIWKYQESEPTEITAELKHVVAKVTLKTTTNVEGGNEIIVTVPTTYVAYNVADETVIQDVMDKNIPFEHTVTNAITGTKDGAEVFSFYALVDEANQDLTLINGTNSQQVSNVPLGPNKHTTLVGDVRNLGLTNVTFTASVVGDWGNDENVDILGYNYDADNNTYNVTSEEGLRAMAELVNDGKTDINITLAKDITLTEVWTPIGNNSNQYTGTFDGNDHAISGLTIDQSGIDYVGLISYIGNGGAVKNLTLEDVNITAARYTGAVAGRNDGTIENCSVSGTVKSSSNNAGGITGYNYGTITGCSASGNVSANAYAGGIVAFFVTGSITDCHSSATVEGNYLVGGVAGNMSDNATLTACFSTGSVTATGSSDADAGGVVGRVNRYATVTACYATGNVTVKQGYNNAGGVAGSSIGGTITACYHSTGTVSGSARVGGVLGRNHTGIDLPSIVTACYWQNEQSQGIGEDQVGTAETTKVEDNWAAAIDKMNEALDIQNINWRYEQAGGSSGGSSLPVLKTAI